MSDRKSVSKKKSETKLYLRVIYTAAGPAVSTNGKGMSCPSWQWHRIGSRWSPVRTLPVAPLWCDLGFVPNSRGNKAAANLRPKSAALQREPNILLTQTNVEFTLIVTVKVNISFRLTTEFPSPRRPAPELRA